MKTSVTISAGVWLALSCAAPSDARVHANRGGQTQSEPSNYNPDQDSQTSTQYLDNSCLHCGAAAGLAQTLPSYDSNGFPITLLQAQAASLKGMHERLSDPTLAGGDIQPSPHQAAVLSAPIQMRQKPLPLWETKGYFITPLELVIFGPNDVKERAPLVEGGLGG